MIKPNYELIIAQRAVRKGSTVAQVRAYLIKHNNNVMLDGKRVHVYGKRVLALMYELLA